MKFGGREGVGAERCHQGALLSLTMFTPTESHTAFLLQRAVHHCSLRGHQCCSLTTALTDNVTEQYRDILVLGGQLVVVPHSVASRLANRGAAGGDELNDMPAHKGGGRCQGLCEWGGPRVDARCLRPEVGCAQRGCGHRGGAWGQPPWMAPCMTEVRPPTRTRAFATPKGSISCPERLPGTLARVLRLQDPHSDGLRRDELRAPPASTIHTRQ